MYLAINYSPPAAELVRAGQINIDYFKTPNWDWIIDEARQLRPVAVHFSLEAGNDSLREVDWEKADQLAQSTGTPHINLHLDAKQLYYPGYAVDTTSVNEVNSVTRVILADVMRAVKHFGPERVIVENSPYQEISAGTLRLCVDPVIISRVVRETGCGFLLDISHAVISSGYFNLSPAEYIAQLPVQSVKELHFAGIHHDPVTGQLIDHLSILEEDWHWLDWVLECIHSGQWSTPWLLAFEYGGVGEIFIWRSNPEVIAEQVPQLYEHLARLNR